MNETRLALNAVRLWRLRRDGSVYDPDDQFAVDQLQRDGYLDPSSHLTDKTVELLIRMKPESRGGFAKKLSHPERTDDD
jgi:hypothetical protein